MEAAISGFLKAISPEYLGLMIDNDYLLIESLFFALNPPLQSSGPKGNPTKNNEELSPEEADKVMAMGKKVGLPLLGAMRFVASRFPYKVVEEKITPEWMLRRGRGKFPALMDIIEAKGPAGTHWLEKQCDEFVQFATGRLNWSPEKRIMIPVQVVLPF